ncbi:PTS glucitol/sorbitol transporter subunit IIA [Aquiluna sp.]|nr:PTS glucitol/sorbitol transporter subunit IIA [Aquiluna sp.]
MTVLYRSTVTEIGELVPTFVAEGMLVFFGEGAPEELKTFCIIHKVEHQEGQVKPGDRVSIDDHSFEVLAVGSVANDNLYNLGHLNLKADGNNEADLPGDVCIAQIELPEITIGTKLEITRSN